MPRSDGLQPPLTPAEREIRKSYGGWTNFMHLYGLKPEDDGDMAEGKVIISALASKDGNEAGAGNGQRDPGKGNGK